MNKKGEKLNHGNKIKRNIRNQYKKIQNIVKELHNKTALYLCKNFENILLPKFETQKMVRIKTKENTIKEIYDKFGDEKGKAEMRKYERRGRLNGRVKFVLMMSSHYKFREHLINKSNEYGCRVEIVTEEYTSTPLGAEHAHIAEFRAIFIISARKNVRVVKRR